jgi:hypothetical protein
MRQHAREQILAMAEIDLREAIFEWAKNHQALTSAEYLKVLLGVCHDQVQSLLKIEIRIERHGDANEPGGAE